MATRLEVAQRAGTSPALVSYVLNGGPRQVAPETEKRIRAAIEELGYRPNRLARSLRMNKTLTLGLLIPDSANPYFAELANAVEDAAFDAGYTLLIGNSAEKSSREQMYLDAFVDHRIDGLILAPSIAMSTGAPITLPAIPIVMLDRTVPSSNAPVVTVDNFTAAAAATQHLIDHGRTRIACIAGPQDVSPAEDRVAGFLSAHSTNEAHDNWIVRAEFGPVGGYAATHALFSDPGTAPNAIFVASDEQAIGAVKALERAGLDCPEDVAIVAFDGISATAFTRPGITTMAQPFVDMGRASVSAIIAAIDDTEPTTTPPLETTLIIRESCGCTPEVAA